MQKRLRPRLHNTVILRLQVRHEELPAPSRQPEWGKWFKVDISRLRMDRGRKAIPALWLECSRMPSWPFRYRMLLPVSTILCVIMSQLVFKTAIGHVHIHVKANHYEMLAGVPALRYGRSDPPQFANTGAQTSRHVHFCAPPRVDTISVVGAPPSSDVAILIGHQAGI
jgi:hypothetical protein